MQSRADSLSASLAIVSIWSVKLPGCSEVSLVLEAGAIRGLGARMLTGSYYGQTIQIWSALFMAAALAATLVMLVGIAHSYVLRRMGEKPEGAAA